MYIPDLFGAYVKGREAAIEKNWQDLKSYETIEQARLNNDLMALDLLGKRADFAGNRSIFQNQVDSSNMNADIQRTAFPGVKSTAQMKSDAGVIQNGVFQANKNEYGDVLNNVFQSRLGKQLDASAVQQAQNAFFTPERTWQMGKNAGNVAYQTSQANNATANNYLNAATQAINQSNANYANNIASASLLGTQIANAAELAPTQQQLAKTNLNNLQHSANNFVANQNTMQKAQQNAITEQAYKEYVSYLQLAKSGDQVAIQAAQRLAQQYGFPMPTMPAMAQPMVSPQPPVTQVVPNPQPQGVASRPLLPANPQTAYPYPVAPAYGTYVPPNPPPYWTNANLSIPSNADDGWRYLYNRY